MDNKELMSIAIETAVDTMSKGFGGPFGAVIVDKDNNFIATGSNHVLKNNDPTAHGEILAIRNACTKLGTYDLTGYKLFTTAYPCPMCLGAIIWSNIKEVYYGCTAEDTANIGFRDDFIYKYIENKEYEHENNILTLIQESRENCLKLFGKYEKIQHTIY